MRPDWLWFAQSGHSYHWNCSNPLNNQSAQTPPITSPDTHTCQVLKLPFVVFLQLPAPEMLITVRDPKTCIFVCVMQSKFRQLSLKSSPGEEEDIPTPKISVPTKQKAFFLPQPQLWKQQSAWAVAAADTFPETGGVHTQTCSGMWEKNFPIPSWGLIAAVFFRRKGELEIRLKISCTSPVLCPRWRKLKCTAHLPQHLWNEPDPKATFQKSDTLCGDSSHLSPF